VAQLWINSADRADDAQDEGRSTCANAGKEPDALLVFLLQTLQDLDGVPTHHAVVVHRLMAVPTQQNQVLCGAPLFSVERRLAAR
jgi:hypothetical protein